MGQAHTKALTKDDLEKLHRETGYSLKRLKLLQSKFMRRADESGCIGKGDFQLVMRNEGYSGPLYEELVFRAIDLDNSESIDVKEFIVGMSFLAGRNQPKSADEAIKFIFSMYDTDMSGQITKEEMNTVVSAVFKMLHAQIVDTVSRWKTPHEFCEAMFTELDLDKDGVVTFEEFSKVAQMDEDILNVLMHPFGEDAEEASAQLKEDLDLSDDDEDGDDAKESD